MPTSGLRLALAAPDTLQELHTRTVVEKFGHWHALCSCGFVIYGCVSRNEAVNWPCEIQALLTIAAERRRHLGIAN